jgi:KEOPS complex subunit Pcc1
VTHVAAFSLTYPSMETASRVEAAIRPEVGDIDDDRSRATLNRDGREVEMVVEAVDLVALRAALNTWLTLADVAERAGGASPG